MFECGLMGAEQAKVQTSVAAGKPDRRQEARWAIREECTRPAERAKQRAAELDDVTIMTKIVDVPSLKVNAPPHGVLKSYSLDR